MKKHIVSLPHHPKRVIVISLIIATSIGIFGYIRINQKPANAYKISNLETITNKNTSLTLGFLSGGRIKSVDVKAGDLVKKGAVLATLDAGNAAGALIQAKAAYATAQANYQKIINGATGSAIDVAKAAVNTAKVNLEGVTNQQNILVKNAYKNLLNSTPEALPYNNSNDYTAPIISGSYNKDTEGQIILTIYASSSLSGYSFSAKGLVTASGAITESVAVPIGDSGLYIKFLNTTNVNITDWVIDIPNKKATNYLANYNAYQAALETKNQTVANAQAALDQANASLTALATTARPEDVAVAQAQVENALGAVKIAEAAYNNTIITAPADGTVVTVSITPDQIAIPNAPAIEFLKTN